MSSNKAKQNGPSEELLKSIDVWLKWDECEKNKKRNRRIKNEL